jgi:hypothetical protein
MQQVSIDYWKYGIRYSPRVILGNNHLALRARAVHRSTQEFCYAYNDSPTIHVQCKCSTVQHSRLQVRCCSIPPRMHIFVCISKTHCVSYSSHPMMHNMVPLKMKQLNFFLVSLRLVATTLILVPHIPLSHFFVLILSSRWYAYTHIA